MAGIVTSGPEAPFLILMGSVGLLGIPESLVRDYPDYVEGFQSVLNDLSSDDSELRERGRRVAEKFCAEVNGWTP